MIEQSAGSEHIQEGLLPLSSRATYPAPVATHEQVAAAPKLFFQTLHQLHEELRTTFTRTPTVAGKELDLHLLYLQVTKLGGLATVIANKRWSTVSEPFQFPSSFTSKSWTLRKVYSRLLHDYEQVYFHGNRGLPIPPPPGPDGSSIEGGAAMTSSSSSFRMLPAAEASRMQSAVQPADGDLLPLTPRAPLSKKRRLDPAPSPPALTAFAMSGSRATPALLPAGTPVHGIVDSHFDLGYVVTITVGSSEFQGVLYRPSEERLHHQGSEAPSREPSPGRALSGGLLAHRGDFLQLRQHLRQLEAQPAPKLGLPHSRTAFTLFSLDVHDMVKKQLPASATSADIEGMVREMWEGASEGQRQPYMDAASAAQEQLFNSSPNTYYPQAQSEEGIVGTEDPQASGGEPSSGHKRAHTSPSSRNPSLNRSGDALTSIREMLHENETAETSDSVSRQLIAGPHFSAANQRASHAPTWQSNPQHGEQPSAMQAGGLQLPSQEALSWRNYLRPLIHAPSPDPFSLAAKHAKALLPSSRFTLAGQAVGTPAASQSQDSSQSSLGLEGLRSVNQFPGFSRTFGGLVQIPAQSESLPRQSLLEVHQASTGKLLSHLHRLDPSMAGAGLAAGLRLPLSFGATPIQGMDVSQLAAFAMGMGGGMHPFAAASSGPGLQASSRPIGATPADSSQLLALEPARQAPFQSTAHSPRRPLATVGPVPADLAPQPRDGNTESGTIHTLSKAIP